MFQKKLSLFIDSIDCNKDALLLSATIEHFTNGNEKVEFKRQNDEISDGHKAKTRHSTFGCFMIFDPFWFVQQIYKKLKPSHQKKVFAMVNRPYDLQNVKSFDQPLIFISQIQRSGGSLLTRLFDAHPQLATHPTEIFCLKNRWPDTRKQKLNSRFNLIDNHNFLLTVFNGVNKGNSKKPGGLLFEFNFDKYESLLTVPHDGDLRSMLNVYFTAFFNAWENFIFDHASLKYIAGFAPRTVKSISENSDQNSFFGSYPNGFLISILRHPKNWYSSAQSHSSAYADPVKAFDIYTAHARAALSLKKERPQKVIMIRFDDLIAQTEAVMKMICSRLDVTYNDVLLTPTFNSNPTLSNSSHNRTYQIDKSVLDRTPDSAVDHLDQYKEALKIYNSAASLFDDL